MLDFRTLSWQLIYFLTDWTHYRLQYYGRARLVNARSGEVLWQAECKILESDEAHAPTMAQLTADEAALLKQHLRRIGRRCAQEYLAQFNRGT